MRENVSVIVPAYNAAGTLRQTVASVRAALPEAEVVIIDDGSLDDTRSMAAELADVFVPRPCQPGAARARNDACLHATGDVFVFVDADVTVTPDAVSGLLAHLRAGADGAFGDYTPLPPAEVRNAPTDYKNLIHHHTHLRCGTTSARTFWSGFGAITREAYSAVGGFDAAVTRERGRRGHPPRVPPPRCRVPGRDRPDVPGAAPQGLHAAGSRPIRRRPQSHPLGASDGSAAHRRVRPEPAAGLDRVVRRGVGDGGIARRRLGEAAGYVLPGRTTGSLPPNLLAELPRVPDEARWRRPVLRSGRTTPRTTDAPTPTETGSSRPVTAAS